MAAVAFVSEESLDDVADQRLHLQDDSCKRVAIVRAARQRFHMGDELAALGVCQCGGDEDLDADLWTTPALQEESTKG